MSEEEKDKIVSQKWQKPKRANKGYNKETGEWWGYYRRGSPLFLYEMEMMDGRKRIAHGKVYSPIYDDGSVRMFFDHYENGHSVDWIGRFNQVFKSDFGSMSEIKSFIGEKGGTFGEFVYFYASRFLPEIKSYRILNHKDYPIRRKNPDRKMWDK